MNYKISNHLDMINVCGWEWCVYAEEPLPYGESRKVLQEGDPQPEYPKMLGHISERDIVSAITQCMELIRNHNPEFSMESVYIHKS